MVGFQALTKVWQLVRELMADLKWRKPGTYRDQLRAFAAISLPKRIE